MLMLTTCLQPMLDTCSLGANQNRATKTPCQSPCGSLLYQSHQLTGPCRALKETKADLLLGAVEFHSLCRLIPLTHSVPFWGQILPCPCSLWKAQSKHTAVSFLLKALDSLILLWHSHFLPMHHTTSLRKPFNAIKSPEAHLVLHSQNSDELSPCPPHQGPSRGLSGAGPCSPALSAHHSGPQSAGRNQQGSWLKDTCSK